MKPQPGSQRREAWIWMRFHKSCGFWLIDFKLTSDSMAKIS
jgi:hypothetical protein